MYGYFIFILESFPHLFFIANQPVRQSELPNIGSCVCLIIVCNLIITVGRAVLLLVTFVALLRAIIELFGASEVIK